MECLLLRLYPFLFTLWVDIKPVLYDSASGSSETNRLPNRLIQPEMDPADRRPTVSTPEVFLSRHGQAIQILLDSMVELTRDMRCLVPSRSSPPSGAAAAGPSPSRGDSHACDPKPFIRDLDKCRGFLLQCQLIFTQWSRAFPSDAMKINYILGLLQGRALTWVQALCAGTHLNTLPLGEFLRRFKRIFDRPNHADCASDRLFTIWQGSLSVAEYAVEFGTLAAEASWDEIALRTAFRRGLTDQVREAPALDPSV